MLKFPREDGVWWMLLTCWGVGWGAAARWAWEPLVIPPLFLLSLGAAQALREARRRAREAGGGARGWASLGVSLSIPAIAAGGWLWQRTGDGPWMAAVAAPAAAYGAFLASGAERRVAARILAIVSVTAVAPSTFAFATDGFGATAGVLWGSLGAYFLLSSLYVMARFRRSPALLWTVRIASTSVFASAVVCTSPHVGHLLLAGVFAVLAGRAWAHRPAAALVPRRVGRMELVFGTASAALILAGILMG